VETSTFPFTYNELSTCEGGIKLKKYIGNNVIKPTKTPTNYKKKKDCGCGSKIKKN
jgi:hypothetical protein